MTERKVGGARGVVGCGTSAAPKHSSLAWPLSRLEPVQART